MRAFIVGLMGLLFCAASPAAAQAPTARASREHEEVAWRSIDPRHEGAGAMALNGEFAILNGGAALQPARTLGGGVGADMRWRRNAWPLSIGVRGGAVFFSDARAQGPIFDASTMVLRHGELLLRIEPWRGLVRPYVEGAFGIASVVRRSALHDEAGVSYLAGVAAGVELKLLQLGQDIFRRWDLLARIGVSHADTGAVQVAGPGSASARLRIWQPFVSVVVVLQTKPRLLPTKRWTK